jgi:serine/threonine protein kinase
MGAVYQGSHLRLSQKVAIKFLASHLMDDQSARDRFEREASIMSSLQHPNIVRLLDFGVTDGKAHPYLVLELLRGETLESKLQREADFQMNQVVEIFSQLASALRAAHRLGVVHRDLKPANIIIESVDGGVFGKLLDFGISKSQTGSSGLTGQFDVMGTPGYMPPEQASGRTAAVDHRADQFGLAACLYEVLTGRSPFEAETVMDTLRNVISIMPPPPSRHSLPIPSALDGVILKALSKDPDDRYPNMDQFGRALRSSVGLSGFTPSIISGPLESTPARTSPRSSEQPTLRAEQIQHSQSENSRSPEPGALSPVPDLDRELSLARAAMLSGNRALSLTHLRTLIAAARLNKGAKTQRTLEDATTLLSRLVSHWGALPSSKLNVENRPENLASQSFLEPEDVYLMSLCDECQSLSDLVDISPLPNAETWHRVAHLLAAGMLSASNEAPSFVKKA